MNQMPLNNQYNSQMPLGNYNNGSSVATNNGQQGTVSVSTPNSQPQIYNYPTTSIYDPNSKQATNGVNIYIYNPSGIGGPSSNSVANATYPVVSPQAPNSTTNIAPVTNNNQSSIASSPISAGPINQVQQNQKTKNVVELTDDYIKTIENYLRSPDESVRKAGIVDLLKRFGEDSSRYDDPALTALLNIALQDPKANNRLLAMSSISGEMAHGDENTVQLLKNLQTSDKLYGQEAKMATEALLKAAQTRTEIIDNDPPKVKSEDDK